MALFRHILVATDFSECSARAVELAIETAKAFHAELTLVHAWELSAGAYTGVEFATLELIRTIGDAAQRQLAEALAAVQTRFPGAKAMLREGNPKQEILRAAEEIGADQVVIGTRGRTGAKRLLMGSVAERVVRACPVAVLTVH
ncbi:MAG: universal stress protein [Polyangiales bacterium]